MLKNQTRAFFLSAALIVLSLVLIASMAFAQDDLSRRYPGWTLRASFEEGDGTVAVWTRLVNGLLYIRRESLPSSDLQEWMPVPVTEAFAEKLRAGGMEDLLAFDGDQVLFLAPEGLDMEKLSAEGEAVWAEVYMDGLTALDDGMRVLVSKRNEYGYYKTNASLPLPEGWTLQTESCGSGRMAFSSADGRGAIFLRKQDGTWQLKQVLLEGKVQYQTETWGIWDMNAASMNSSEGTVFGQFPWLDLFTAEFATLPGTFEEAGDHIDRAGWAVVNNPRPTESLNLRSLPDETSRSLGKFYNRTPVEVLSWQGSWSLVRIGSDLEGWMQTKYLFFGRQMDSVRCAFPVIPDEMTQTFLASRQNIGEDLIGVPCFWYVGIQGDYAMILNSSRELYAIPRKAVD